MNQKNGSILVRAITVGDVDTLMALTGNPHVVRYLPGMIQDREYAAAWIRGLTSNDHEMMVLHDGKVIGECSLTVHGDSGEIGLMLFPEHWERAMDPKWLHCSQNLQERLACMQSQLLHHRRMMHVSDC